MREIAKEAGYYDHIFETEAIYKDAAYRKLNHFLVFVRVMQYIEASGREFPIIELGCGCGQLAQYLEDENLTNYLGVDFSEEGLKVARRLSKQEFLLYDLREGVGGIFKNKGVEERSETIFVATEVLEHIQEDEKLIRSLPDGCQFIFSVPNFDCEGHVRYFENSGGVYKAYSHLLDFKHETIIDGRFVYNTVKKGVVQSKCNLPTKTLNIVF